MSWVGSYMVKSLTINRVQISLLRLAVFTESRQSLKDLETTALQILTVASGHKYCEQEILKKKIICEDRQFSIESIGYRRTCRRN